MEKYAWSNYEEGPWYPVDGSRNDCIKEAKLERELLSFAHNRNIYIGKCIEPILVLDAEDIVERVFEDFDASYGTELCDFFYPSKKQIADLDEKLNVVFNDWLESIGGVNYWMIEDVEKID